MDSLAGLPTIRSQLVRIDAHVKAYVRYMYATNGSDYYRQDVTRGRHGARHSGRLDPRISP